MVKNKKNYAQYISSCCGFPIKIENKQTYVLLQLRQNTGFADGMWEAGVAGHVDNGETMSQALIRESKEELGITINNSNIQFITLTNKSYKEGKTTKIIYIASFLIKNWNGELKINEPQKNAKIQWFNIKELPDNLIIDRRHALENFQKGIYYSNCCIK